jgi:hypothetical protein
VYYVVFNQSESFLNRPYIKSITVATYFVWCCCENLKLQMCIFLLVSFFLYHVNQDELQSEWPFSPYRRQKRTCCCHGLGDKAFAV